MISKAIIEIPKFSYVKTEYKNGEFVVDRMLDIQCPQNYGFIPGTEAEDGDPLDVFVCTPDPLYTGYETAVEIIGEFVCEDRGVVDNKLIAYIKDEDCAFDVKTIQYYLDNYKKGFKVISFKPSFTVEDMMRYIK